MVVEGIADGEDASFSLFSVLLHMLSIAVDLLVPFLVTLICFLLLLFSSIAWLHRDGPTSLWSVDEEYDLERVAEPVFLGESVSVRVQVQGVISAFFPNLVMDRPLVFCVVLCSLSFASEVSRYVSSYFLPDFGWSTVSFSFIVLFLCFCA